MIGRALPISPPVFAILSALIEERLGLLFEAGDAALLAEKLSPRAHEHGFESLLDYYYFLRYDAHAEQELAQLADALVVNETYFLRELDQVLALVDDILPRLLAARGGRLRVWSAACSTGEEPLTICGLLHDRGLLPRVEIVASDLSLRALRVARSGRFSGRALRALGQAAAADMTRGWFDFDNGAAVIRPDLLREVSFQQLNLLDAAAVSALGAFDVILCRNVLIYFRDSTIEGVVRRLTSSLVMEGYLLVGASESLLRFDTGLKCEEHGGAFFYRKVPV